MITIATLALIVALLNTAVLAYALLYDRRYRIDTRRIGGAIATSLIDRYGDEINVLSESGVKKSSRERYLELCGAFGLPETAVTAVTTETWRLIHIAQGQPDGAGIALYE